MLSRRGKFFYDGKLFHKNKDISKMLKIQIFEWVTIPVNCKESPKLKIVNYIISPHQNYAAIKQVLDISYRTKD